ncbi:MAG TPA: hypothetical protein VKD23_04650 [Terriglobales bacterium]|nr:hypothetical protein [Terriglobales bacterium]
MYATLFIGLLLVFVAVRILERSGMVRPALLGGVGYAGIVLAVAVGMLTVWCVVTFALIGRGWDVGWCAGQGRELGPQGYNKKL